MRTTKAISILTLVILCTPLSSQSVADFENLGVPIDTFNNGASGDTLFASGEIALPIAYDTMFMSWSGWAISTVRDTITAGFGNQYASFAGGGAEGSATYAVSSAFLPTIMRTGGRVVEGLYLTNTTYTALSMRDGDMFAKAFGGPTGNDPDFYSVTVRGYSAGTLTDDSVTVFLADYRFEDNSQDYILDDWRFVELDSLGAVDSLRFRVNSSDVGRFGINTPAYFAVDGVRTEVATGTSNPAKQLNVQVYPNPFTTELVVNGSQGRLRYELFDLAGRLRQEGTLISGQRLQVNALENDFYLLRLTDAGGGVAVRRLLRVTR